MAYTSDRIDIHGYQKQLRIELSHVHKSSIHPEWKRLLLAFDAEQQIQEHLQPATRIKTFNKLRLFIQDYFPTQAPSEVTAEALKVAYQKTQERYAPWTHATIWKGIKKLYRFIEHGDQYRIRKETPAIVAWAKSTPKRSELREIENTDLLTEDEVNLLIQHAENPRDRALIAVLYDLGARVGEVGGMLRKHVKKDGTGYIFDLVGKTGRRTPLGIISAPYLRDWLNFYDTMVPDNADLPLWPIIKRYTASLTAYKTSSRAAPVYPMTHAAINAALRHVCKRAGITKRVHAHLFRHSRATFLAAEGIMNELQLKQYLGWSPDSKMLGTYAHLRSQDANKCILQQYGGVAVEKTAPKVNVTFCGMCRQENAPHAKFCGHCGHVMNVKVANDMMMLAGMAKDDAMIDAIARRVLALGTEKAPDTLKELLALSEDELRTRLASLKKQGQITN